MNRFKNKFKEADKAFNSVYEEALKQLYALSEEELSTITPDTTSKEVYKQLGAIIEEATHKNISQAEFINRVKQLGENAQKIIEKIPVLNDWF